MITVEIARNSVGNLVVWREKRDNPSIPEVTYRTYRYPGRIDVETVGGSVDGLKITPHCPELIMPLSAWGILCFVLGMILMECWGATV